MDVKLIGGALGAEIVGIDLKNSSADNFDLIKVEYVSIRNPKTFEELKIISEDFIILIAAFVGKTRLIDNIKYVEKL